MPTCITFYLTNPHDKVKGYAAWEYLEIGKGTSQYRTGTRRPLSNIFNVLNHSWLGCYCGEVDWSNVWSRNPPIKVMRQLILSFILVFAFGVLHSGSCKLPLSEERVCLFVDCVDGLGSFSFQSGLKVRIWNLKQKENSCRNQQQWYNQRNLSIVCRYDILLTLLILSGIAICHYCDARPRQKKINLEGLPINII